MKKILGIGLMLTVLLFVIIQLVPYGRQHRNPAVVAEPAWGSPEARVMAQRACYDCHSNETVWPWYSNIAPISWLIQHDVDEGRRELNFSEWGVRRVEGGERGEGRERGERSEEIGEKVYEGEMPPPYYVLLHPSANLSSAEKQVLVEGLQAAARK